MSYMSRLAEIIEEYSASDNDYEFLLNQVNDHFYGKRPWEALDYNAKLVIDTWECENIQEAGVL